MALNSNGYVWDGSRWKHIGPVDSIAPSDLSCTTRNFCLIIDGWGRWLRWNGRTWSQPVDVGGTVEVGGLSCSSSTACFAVDRRGRALVFDGTSWSREHVTTGRDLLTISCTPREFCVAASGQHVYARVDGVWSGPTRLITTKDEYGDGPISCPISDFCALIEDFAGVATYDGSVWGKPQRVDPTRVMSSISCASATFCAAGDVAGYAMTYDGTSWTEPLAVSSAQIVSMSCPVEGFCMAGALNGRIYRYDAGSGWDSGASVFTGFTNVSCASADVCVAVDTNGNASVYHDGQWGAPQRINPHAAPSTISCPTVSFCLVLFTDGSYVTYDGTSFTDPIEVDGLDGGDVSCASSDFCAVIDRDGAAATFDGNTWGDPVQVMATADLGSRVSCSAPSHCWGASYVGFVAEYTD
jgi:hypothetical protein